MVFRQYHLELALRMMVEAGVKALELWPPQIESCRGDRLSQQLVEFASALGLKLVRLNAAGADYFTALRSRDDGKQIIEGLKRDIDWTASLGMSQLVSWEGPKPRGAAQGDIHGWILEETVRIFRQAVEYGRQKGVSVSVEVHPNTLGMDLDFLIKLCDRVGSEFFGVTYDCCHFGIGLPDGYIGAILKLRDRIKHVHFSDSDQHTPELHFPPGKGCLDLEGIVAALKEIRFNGTFMLDLWLYPLPEEGLRIGVPYLRRVVRALERRARAATVQSFPKAVA